MMAGWFGKMSWKTKAVIIGVILVSGFFAGKKIFFGKKGGYVMGTVQRRTVTEVVAESGIITTNGSVSIYSPTNGVVGEVLVTNGDKVSEKQKLFTVKSTATPQEKAAALAAFQTAKTTLQQAENNRRLTQATVDRVHDDVKNHDKDETWLQRETRTTAEVAHDNAYDALVSAQAGLVSAQLAYQATQNATVTAPVAGTISNLSVASGSGVTVNSLLTPSSPVLLIEGPGEAEVAISVGESDVNKIHIGQDAEIFFEAIDNQTYRGKVSRVDTKGTITQSVVKYNVYLEILEADDQLKPGMTADVDIVTNTLTDVLSVPNTAVKPYQKGRAVRKPGKGGEVEYIPVTVGVRGKEFTQIIQGLEEGQEIIVSLTNEKTERKSMFGF